MTTRMRIGNRAVDLGSSARTTRARMARVEGPPALSGRLVASENDRDVVLAARFVGSIDKALASFLRLIHRIKDTADLLVGHHLRQPVGTEEQAVVGFKMKLVHLHLDVG